MATPNSNQDLGVAALIMIIGGIMEPDNINDVVIYDCAYCGSKQWAKSEAYMFYVKADNQMKPLCFECRNIFLNAQNG